MYISCRFVQGAMRDIDLLVFPQDCPQKGTLMDALRNKLQCYQWLIALKQPKLLEYDAPPAESGRAVGRPIYTLNEPRFSNLTSC
jgi:hypothetical protein